MVFDDVKTEKSIQSIY